MSERLKGWQLVNSLGQRKCDRNWKPLVFTDRKSAQRNADKNAEEDAVIWKPRLLMIEP